MTTHTCACGYATENRGCLTNHGRRCLGPNPTLDDLYRIGGVVRTTGGCDEWRARVSGTPEGHYGVLPSIAARQLGEALAHRAAHLLAHGPIPDGLLVLHSCDNPPCVRPEHIRAGTRAENTDDMIRRGRGRGQWQPGQRVVA